MYSISFMLLQQLKRANKIDNIDKRKSLKKGFKYSNDKF